MGKPEVALGIVVANVADHVAEEFFVVGEFSVFDVLADDVAEQASEVFVTGEGHVGSTDLERSDVVTKSCETERHNPKEDHDRSVHRTEHVIGLPCYLAAILYNLNPRDNAVLACACGSFQESPHRGKVQFGSGWWYNDTLQGMEDQINTLSSIGLLAHRSGEE